MTTCDLVIIASVGIGLPVVVSYIFWLVMWLGD